MQLVQRSGDMIIMISLLSLIFSGTVCAEGQSRFKPDFFSQVAPISMEDKLAATLGAVEPGGVFVYNYEDAVKMAGHSCLAVAGGYRLTRIALKKLYGKQTPVRGEIEVVFKKGVDYKVNGPISQVVTLITGAATDTGFKGFKGGKFKRHNLLRFDQSGTIPAGALCSVIFKRLDTGKSVEITYSNSMVPPLPDMQEKVRIVLLDEVENMFVITE